MARASFLFFAFLISVSVRAQEWHYVGDEGFSTKYISDCTIAIYNDTLYVAYTDWTNSLKCSMMKFNGTDWAYVGSPGFSADTAIQNTIAFDSHGSPYVAYRDYGNGQKATVMKFNGSEWVPVGTPGFSPAMVGYPSIAIDNNNIAYVAYVDFNNIYDGASVMKFNGTDWVNVGMPGFSMASVSNTQIAIDKIGTLYVIFNSGNVLVMTYNGTNWEFVGRSASNGDVDDNTIAIDDSGHIYIAYSYLEGSTYAAKYNAVDSSWLNIGENGLVYSNQSDYLSMALDGNDSPYVAFMDRNTFKPIVRKYNGTDWEYVGLNDSSGIFGTTDQEANWISVAINSENIPYVAFVEEEDPHPNQVSVMAYSSATTGITSIPKTRTSLNIFPNPGQNIASIEWQINPANKDVHIQIYDMLGNQVIDLETNNSGQAQVDISGLANGMYIVKLLLDDQTTMDARLGVVR